MKAITVEPKIADKSDLANLRILFHEAFLSFLAAGGSMPAS